MPLEDAQNTTGQSVKSDQLSDVVKPELHPAPETTSEYPSMGRVAIIMCSIYITMFLIALVC